MANPTRAVLDTVWLRDQSRCFLCSRQLHRGHGGYSVHHRVPRGMGGSREPELNQPPNLILLCGSGTDGCHGWVESNRKAAMDLGLIVSRFHQTAIELVAVRRWGAHWVTLQPDGTLITGV